MEREREVVGTGTGERAKSAAQNSLHRKTTNGKTLKSIFKVIVKFSVQNANLLLRCLLCRIKHGKGT